MNMRRILVALLSLLVAVSFGLLVVGCESMDSSKADVSSSTESTSTTVAVQLDDELLGIWSGLGEDGVEAIMFDSDGRMYYMSMDPEQEIIELVYRVEGARLIFGDLQGLNEASAIYSVEGDALTVTDPDTGEVTTYDRVRSAAGQTESAQAILGRWELLDDQGYVDLEWEFYEDDTCRMGVWDPLTETYVYYNYEYEIESDVLVFYDDEGNGSAAQAISIVNDSLTMVNIFDPEISVTLQRAGSLQGPDMSTEEMLIPVILGVWAQAGEQAHHQGEDLPLSAWTFHDDGTASQHIWDPAREEYDMYEYVWGLEGNVLTFYDNAGAELAIQSITIVDGVLTMINVNNSDIQVAFERPED